MKLAIIVLAALNVALLGAWAGLFGPVAGDSPEPQRLAQQVRPEQLRVVGPGPSIEPAGASSGSGRAAGSAAAGGAAADPAGTGAAGSASPGGIPPGAVASGVPSAASTGAGVPSPAAAGTPSTPAAPAGPACVEWGLFTEAELPRAQAALAQAAPTGRVEPLRTDAGPRSWIVHIAPLPDLAAAQARAAQLRAGGFDVYVFRDGPLRNGISLGLFRQEEAALAQQRALAQRGVADAQIASRGAERWVLRITGEPPVTAEQRTALAGRFRDRPLRECGA